MGEDERAATAYCRETRWRPVDHPREHPVASINAQLEKVVTGDDLFELRAA